MAVDEIKKSFPLVVGMKEYEIQCGTHKYFIKLCIMESKIPTKNWQRAKADNKWTKWFKVDITISSL